MRTAQETRKWGADRILRDGKLFPLMESETEFTLEILPCSNIQQ